MYLRWCYHTPVCVSIKALPSFHKLFFIHPHHSLGQLCMVPCGIIHGLVCCRSPLHISVGLSSPPLSLSFSLSLPLRPLFLCEKKSNQAERERQKPQYSCDSLLVSGQKFYLKRSWFPRHPVSPKELGIFLGSIKPHHRLFCVQKSQFLCSRFLQEGHRAGCSPALTWLLPTKPNFGLILVGWFPLTLSLAMMFTNGLGMSQVTQTLSAKQNSSNLSRSSATFITVAAGTLWTFSKY